MKHTLKIVAALTALAILTGLYLLWQVPSSQLEAPLPVATLTAPAAPAAPLAMKAIPAAVSSLPVNPRVAEDIRLAAEEGWHPALRIMGKNNPLGLTLPQADKIMAAWRHFTAARDALEAKVAYIELNNPDEKMIVIPAYATQAKPLIDNFVDTVAAITNAETAAKLMAQSDLGYEASTTGQYEKVVDVRPAATPGLYDITTTQDTPTTQTAAQGRSDYNHIMQVGYIRKFLASN